MHYHHERFIQAIREKRKVILTHFTGERDCNMTRICVPVDYSLPDAEDNPGCYYVWDSEADVGGRLIALPIWQVKSMELSEETFDPSEYVIPEPD